MELPADLVGDLIRQRAETDAGQGHALAVFIKFLGFQLGMAGIPDKKKIPPLRKPQFLGHGLCL